MTGTRVLRTATLPQGIDFGKLRGLVLLELDLQGLNLVGNLEDIKDCLDGAGRLRDPVEVQLDHYQDYIS